MTSLPDKRRFSMASLMVLVLVMAADFAVLRHVWDGVTRQLAIMTLKTLNLMLLGLWRSHGDRDARPFWVGFEVVACGMIGLVFLLNWGYLRRDWDFFIYPILWLMKQGWISENGTYEVAKGYGCFLAIYAGPQVLAASIAGWLTARYRIVRRNPPIAKDGGRDPINLPNRFLHAEAPRMELPGASTR